jgi:hypothetical protein
MGSERRIREGLSLRWGGLAFFRAVLDNHDRLKVTGEPDGIQ